MSVVVELVKFLVKSQVWARTNVERPTKIYVGDSSPPDPATTCGRGCIPPSLAWAEGARLKGSNRCSTLHASGDTPFAIHRTVKNALSLPRLNLAPPPVPANLLVVLLNVAPYKSAEVAWLAVGDCFT